jgi:hypothetical protein
MVFSDYTKERILCFHRQGLLSTAIQKELQKEDITASVVGIWKLIQVLAAPALFLLEWKLQLKLRWKTTMRLQHRNCRLC